MQGPDYSGGSLVNLVAELERRLGGDAPSPGLHPHLAELIPDAETYVLVLFDGLGDGQLSHEAAAPLRRDRKAAIDSPFPATTTVSLATLSTGLAPSQHGLLGYQLWMPDVGHVVNTIKWTTLWGEPVEYDTAGLLPEPNLWERLSAAGVEPVTAQPYNFADTGLTKALYRGCRFEPYYTEAESVEAALDLAAASKRLVFVYLPHVDFAAHVFGQQDESYAHAVDIVATAWSGIVEGLPEGVVAVGTADHGHIDFPKTRQVQIPRSAHAGKEFYGDGRAMFVKGSGNSMAKELPATWVPLDQMIGWWGPEPRHHLFDERAPDGVLLADDGHLLLHRFSDTRMVGNHGGLVDDERLIPLLVAGD